MKGTDNIDTGTTRGRQPGTATATATESNRHTVQDGLVQVMAAAPWAAKEPDTAAIPPGRRRLKHILRDEQRPMESRLYHLRRVHQFSDARISALLDLHPDDLDALAATHGQL